VTSPSWRSRRDLGRSKIQGLDGGDNGSRHGDSDDDAASLGWHDPEARPLPDDDVLSAVAAWIRRDISLHHELASASTTTMAAGSDLSLTGLIWACFFYFEKMIFGVSRRNRPILLPLFVVLVRVSRH
jgi:hypothetical protein